MELEGGASASLELHQAPVEIEIRYRNQSLRHGTKS